MAEHIVVLFFVLGFLDGQLQFALHFPHKQVVYHNVVGTLLQLVLDPHQLELPPHLLATVQQIHRLKHTDETRLVALQLRPQQIAHSEHHQTDFLGPGFGFDVDACPEEVVDEQVEVIEGEVGQHCVDLGGHLPDLPVPADVISFLPLFLSFFEDVADEAVAGLDNDLILLLDFPVLFLELFDEFECSLVLRQDSYSFVVDGLEGVASLQDVLFWFFHDLLEVACPLGHDPQEVRILGPELLPIYLFAGELLHEGRYFLSNCRLSCLLALNSIFYQLQELGLDQL